MDEVDEVAMCVGMLGAFGDQGEMKSSLVAKWVQKSCVKRYVLVRQLHVQTFAC